VADANVAFGRTAWRRSRWSFCLQCFNCDSGKYIYSYSWRTKYSNGYIFSNDKLDDIPVFNDLGQYNLLVGIGFMAVGFTFATRWE